jgi:hypothetical protein
MVTLIGNEDVDTKLEEFKYLLLISVTKANQIL